MSAPVLSWLFTAQGKEHTQQVSAHRPRGYTEAAASAPRSRYQPHSTLSRRSTALHTRPLSPALRANPFPEVTDLFCRLPLPTLFYGLEAAHLGDLMRL